MNAVFGLKHRQQHFAQQPREVHTITDRFSVANTYLIASETLVVIDPGSLLNVEMTLDYIQHYLKRAPADIDLIVLTHLHPEHTAGVDPLRKVCNAPVAALRSVEQGSRTRPGITRFAGRLLPGAFHHLDLFPSEYERQVKLVDIWLDDVTGLPNHPNWRVIASPGHSVNSLCLYNPFSCELICGDTIIIMEGGTPLLYGNISNRRQLQETLHLLRGLEVYYLYPGHGRPILSKHPLSNVVVE